MFRGRKANPCSNKYTYNKHIEHCQKMHRERLLNMKPAIDNKAPKRPSHLKSNKKREQMLEDRFSKIERDNRLLLNKMSLIMQKNTLDNRNQSWRYARSLNKSYRKKELERITLENQQILRRIQEREPNYNHTKWVEERKLHEQYLRNICEYPYQGGKKGTQQLGHSASGQIPTLNQEYTEEAMQRLQHSASAGHELSPRNIDVLEPLDG